MKKPVFFSPILMIMLLSCDKVTNDNSRFDYSDIPAQLDTRAGDLTEDPFRVSLADANSFIDIHYPNKDYVITPIVEDIDTLLFIYNFDKGWAVVSGDKRTTPILGYDEDSNLSLTTTNENLLFWLEELAQSLRFIKANAFSDDNVNTRLWQALSHSKKTVPSMKKGRDVDYKWGVWKQVEIGSQETVDSIPHLIQTKWGQSNDPTPKWNYKCPIDVNSSPALRCPTGCTAVAMSQLIYYCHYQLGKPTALYHAIIVDSLTIHGPQTIIGFERGSFIPNSGRWDMMAKTSTGSGNTSFVGDLMMDVGNRVGMEYSGSGSGAMPSLSVLSNYYGIDGVMHSYYPNLVLSSIQNEMPVMIVGYKPGGAGHTWLIDGYVKKRIDYLLSISFSYDENWMYADEYYDTFDELRQRYNINDGTEILLVPHYSSYKQYWLMNWGYNGDHDYGLYSITPGASWLQYSNPYKIYYGFE